MKKILIIGLLLAFSVSLNAQNNIVVEKEGENTTLSIAGMQFTFGDKPTVQKSQRTRSPRISSNFLGKVRLGYNYLTNNDAFDFRRNKSTHFSMDLYTIKAYLDRSKTVSLSTGVQFVYSDFVFSNDRSLYCINNGIEYFYIDYHPKKSKVAGNYLGIPLYLDVHVSKLKLSLMGFANYNLSSFTRVNYHIGKDKRDFRGLNEFQYGIGASLSYGNLGLYAMYSAAPFFRPNTILDGYKSLERMNTVSVGLILNLD